MSPLMASMGWMPARVGGLTNNRPIDSLYLVLMDSLWGLVTGAYNLTGGDEYS